MSIQNAMLEEFDNINFFVSCITNQSNYTQISDKSTNSFADNYVASSSKPIFVEKYSTASNMPSSRLKFVSSGETYCSSGNDQLWCTVVGLLA